MNVIECIQETLNLYYEIGGRGSSAYNIVDNAYNKASKTYYNNIYKADSTPKHRFLKKRKHAKIANDAMQHATRIKFITRALSSPRGSDERKQALASAKQFKVK